MWRYKNSFDYSPYQLFGLHHSWVRKTKHTSIAYICIFQILKFIYGNRSDNFCSLSTSKCEQALCMNEYGGFCCFNVPKKVFSSHYCCSILVFSVFYPFKLPFCVWLPLLYDSSFSFTFAHIHMVNCVQISIFPHRSSKIYFIGKVCFVCCRLKWKCKWVPRGRTEMELLLYINCSKKNKNR